MISKWRPPTRRYVRFKIHSFHACNGPSIKFCVQSLNIIMSCSEIRKSWVLFMPSSCLISDLFRALTFCLLALVFISVATVQTEPKGVFYLLLNNCICFFIETTIIWDYSTAIWLTLDVVVCQMHVGTCYVKESSIYFSSCSGIAKPFN